MCIGGPALIVYVTPTEEELFKVRHMLRSKIACSPVCVLTLPQRYNPELQKRSLANRQERQQDFDNFVSKMKEYSKSSKPSMPSHMHPPPPPRPQPQPHLRIGTSAYEIPATIQYGQPRPKTRRARERIRRRSRDEWLLRCRRGGRKLGDIH